MNSQDTLDLRIPNDTLKNAITPSLKNDVQDRYSKDARFSLESTKPMEIPELQVSPIFEKTSINGDILAEGLVEASAIKDWDELDDEEKEQFKEKLIKEYQDKKLYDESIFTEDFIKKIYNQRLSKSHTGVVGKDEQSNKNIKNEIKNQILQNTLQQSLEQYRDPETLQLNIPKYLQSVVDTWSVLDYDDKVKVLSMLKNGSDRESKINDYYKKTVQMQNLVHQMYQAKDYDEYNQLLKQYKELDDQVTSEYNQLTDTPADNWLTKHLPFLFDDAQEAKDSYVDSDTYTEKMNEWQQLIRKTHWDFNNIDSETSVWINDNNVIAFAVKDREAVFKQGQKKAKAQHDFFETPGRNFVADIAQSLIEGIVTINPVDYARENWAKNAVKLNDQNMEVLQNNARKKFDDRTENKKAVEDLTQSFMNSYSEAEIDKLFNAVIQEEGSRYQAYFDDSGKSCSQETQSMSLYDKAKRIIKSRYYQQLLGSVAARAMMDTLDNDWLEEHQSTWEFSKAWVGEQLLSALTWANNRFNGMRMFTAMARDAAMGDTEVWQDSDMQIIDPERVVTENGESYYLTDSGEKKTVQKIKKSREALLTMGLDSNGADAWFSSQDMSDMETWNTIWDEDIKRAKKIGYSKSSKLIKSTDSQSIWTDAMFEITGDLAGMAADVFLTCASYGTAALGTKLLTKVGCLGKAYKVVSNAALTQKAMTGIHALRPWAAGFGDAVENATDASRNHYNQVLQESYDKLENKVRQDATAKYKAMLQSDPNIQQELAAFIAKGLLNYNQQNPNAVNVADTTATLKGQLASQFAEQYIDKFMQDYKQTDDYRKQYNDIQTIAATRTVASTEAQVAKNMCLNWFSQARIKFGADRIRRQEARRQARNIHWDRENKRFSLTDEWKNDDGSFSIKKFSKNVGLSMLRTAKTETFYSATDVAMGEAGSAVALHNVDKYLAGELDAESISQHIASVEDSQIYMDQLKRSLTGDESLNEIESGLLSKIIPSINADRITEIVKHKHLMRSQARAARERGEEFTPTSYWDTHRSLMDNDRDMSLMEKFLFLTNNEIYNDLYARHEGYNNLRERVNQYNTSLEHYDTVIQGAVNSIALRNILNSETDPTDADTATTMAMIEAVHTLSNPIDSLDAEMHQLMENDITAEQFMTDPDFLSHCTEEQKKTLIQAYYDENTSLERNEENDKKAWEAVQDNIRSYNKVYEAYHNAEMDLRKWENSNGLRLNEEVRGELLRKAALIPMLDKQAMDLKSELSKLGYNVTDSEESATGLSRTILQKSAALRRWFTKSFDEQFNTVTTTLDSNTKELQEKNKRIEELKKNLQEAQKSRNPEVQEEIDSYSAELSKLEIEANNLQQINDFYTERKKKLQETKKFIDELQVTDDNQTLTKEDLQSMDVASLAELCAMDQKALESVLSGSELTIVNDMRDSIGDKIKGLSRTLNRKKVSQMVVETIKRDPQSAYIEMQWRQEQNLRIADRLNVLKGLEFARQDLLESFNSLYNSPDNNIEGEDEQTKTQRLWQLAVQGVSRSFFQNFVQSDIKESIEKFSEVMTLLNELVNSDKVKNDPMQHMLVAQLKAMYEDQFSKLASFSGFFQQYFKLPSDVRSKIDLVKEMLKNYDWADAKTDQDFLELLTSFGENITDNDAKEAFAKLLSDYRLTQDSEEITQDADEEESEQEDQNGQEDQQDQQGQQGQNDQSDQNDQQDQSDQSDQNDQSGQEGGTQQNSESSNIQSSEPEPEPERSTDPVIPENTTSNNVMTANNLNTAPVVAENGVVISNNDNTILGNPFYGYETNNDKKTRGVQQQGSVGETYINWQESNNFNIQDVIDNVLPLVLSQNPSDIPNIRLMCVPGVYDDNRGFHIERPLLCIPYTNKVQQAYQQVYGDKTDSDNNKGVVLVDVDGKPEKFLVIGCTGYDDQNRQLVAFNNLRNDPNYLQALNEARQKNTKNPVIIPNIEYTFTNQGLTAGRVESTQGESRPISELLDNDESNPQQLHVNSLGLGYVDANGTVVINDMPIQNDAQTKAMSDEAKQAKAGQYYLLVPNGKGYSKIFIEPPVLKPYSENDGKNKDAYHKSLKETMKTAIEAVQQFHPKYAKILLSKFLYLYGDVKVDFGDTSNPVITITKADGTIVVLNGQDIDEDFKNLCETGIRLTFDIPSSIKNQLLQSGLLTTNAKSLVCYNKTFAVKPIRQTQNSQQSSQNQQQSQTSQTSSSSETTITINGTQYTTQNGTFNHIQDSDLKNLCECALYIQNKELKPVDTQKYSNIFMYKDRYYTLDNGNLRKSTDEEIKKVIEFSANQAATQSISSASTENNNNNQQSDNDTGFDSSQRGVNSINAPIDVQTLRNKSAQIERDRANGHRGKAVTTVAGLLVGETHQKAYVGNTEVKWSETPGALPATQVGNIMDSFCRLFFQSDALEFHNAAKHSELANFFPNITEDNLQKIYNRFTQIKNDLMPDGENNYEVISDELWLETTIPVQDGDTQKALLVHGKPDLIIRNKKTGKYVIIDFKTKYTNDINDKTSGNFKNNTFDAKTKLKYWYQLQLYKKALEDMGCQVESTQLLISGVNYSRNFDIDAYNNDCIYTSDGECKTVAYAPNDTGHKHPLTPYYNNALSATTSDGSSPFNNDANRSTKSKNSTTVHYKPVPLEGDSTTISQVNDDKGNGILWNTITDSPAEVQVGNAQPHTASELCENQSVNTDLVLEAQVLRDNDIEVPQKPYAKSKPKYDIRQMSKELRKNGDLTNTSDIVPILQLALGYKNSTETLQTVNGVTEALTTLLQFKLADGTYINQSLIAWIKEHKQFPEKLTQCLKCLKFSDDDIHNILLSIAKIPEINVSIDSGNSETLVDKYQNILAASNYTVSIDGNIWTINNRRFELTNEGFVAQNDDSEFIQKLKQNCPNINIITSSTSSNNSEISLTDTQQKYAEKGKALDVTNSRIIQDVLNYLKQQNQTDPEAYKWINSPESICILAGWIQDNFPNAFNLNSRLVPQCINQIKNKIPCFK